ncbi:TVP38/TMEM64 family protein [Jannaschia ovalis]|uniref:TVP38/TMEM64 family membrane protein n=1 Tax=Jannaschia ovalis TaxID=3038773 RepID=A0ABY8LCC8_9RHOB|nr:TVP38/TMEM64 family protein [Jannaschia sp. GRR-S6-38]WGH78985.1 TVP38/TMEM64 family protein [Jannaschia sp. GRR-S6-38]
MTYPQPKPIPAWQVWLWPILLVALGIGLWLLPWRDAVPELRLWVEAQGAPAWLAFVAIYVLVVILPLPAAAMSVVGGLVFGWWGFPLSMLGSILGAVPPYWIGRIWLHGPVRRRLGGPRVNAADRALAQRPFVFVTLLRLTPILPFTLQNWLLGLTSVGFWPYVWATLLGLAPGTLGMVWIGELGGLAAARAAPETLAIASAGLILFGGVILWLGRMATEELRRAGLHIGRVR